MTDNRVTRVEQACIDLVATGQDITIDAVAAKAGIGRATIYRHPELNAVIHEHRRHNQDAVTLTSLTIQIDQLRQALEAVAAKVRHHEELLRKLNRSAIKRTG